MTQRANGTLAERWLLLGVAMYCFATVRDCPGTVPYSQTRIALCAAGAFAVQERMANNHVYVFRKSQPSKYAYVAECRCVLRQEQPRGWQGRLPSTLAELAACNPALPAAVHSALLQVGGGGQHTHSQHNAG
jgi:hypothetical protein